MPINRPDGRHWCAPDQETPDENGRWTCPECSTAWSFDESQRLWSQIEVSN